MRTEPVLASLHIAFRHLDTHTRVLVSVLEFGPFLLLLVVMFVHARRVARDQAAEQGDELDVEPFEEPTLGSWLPKASRDRDSAMPEHRG